jgi:hypothetical protein
MWERHPPEGGENRKLKFETNPVSRLRGSKLRIGGANQDLLQRMGERVIINANKF